MLLLHQSEPGATAHKSCILWLYTNDQSPLTISTSKTEGYLEKKVRSQDSNKNKLCKHDASNDRIVLCFLVAVYKFTVTEVSVFCDVLHKGIPVSDCVSSVG